MNMTAEVEDRFDSWMQMAIHMRLHSWQNVFKKAHGSLANRVHTGCKITIMSWAVLLLGATRRI
eukprot:244207-Pelagomonas_calceolata.AAC.1